MTTVVFNNDVEFDITEYNRSTQYNDGLMTSTCFIKFGEINNTNRGIYNLGNTTITSIKVKSDETVIGELNNLNAAISSIVENLNGTIIELSTNIVLQ